MRVKLFQFLGFLLSAFCLLGGFSLGSKMAGLILQSGVIGVGPHGGWPAMMLVLGMGAACAALCALMAHRLVPALGSILLSNDDWHRYAAPLGAKSNLYAMLVIVFSLPFMGAGIVMGFLGGKSLAHAGVLGIEPSGWPVIFLSLGLAMIGIYLGALIGYTLVLLVGSALFGRERMILAFDALPKAPATRTGLTSRLMDRPFNVISNRVLGTNY